MTAYLTDLKGRQLEAATSRGRDLVVTAGAGTGKTRTLVARYLSLLDEGLSPRQILAITFTEKAAREMRNRVRSAVRLEIDAEADPVRAAFWSNLEAGLDAARIGTIHSFCAEVLRSHPAEAGVDPQFEVADEANAAFLQQQAVETALALATQEHDLAPLFASFSPLSIADLIAFLLRRRLDVGDVLQGGAAPERARQMVAAALASFLDSQPVQTAIAELRQLESSGRLEADASDKLANQVRALLAEFGQAEAHLAQGNPIAAGAALFTIRRQHTRLNIGKKDSRAKDAVRRIRDVYEDRLEPWLGGGKTDDAPPDEAVEQRFAEDLQRVIAVHGLAAQFYRRSLDEKSTLDFDDLEANTVRLLGLPQVRQAWQAEMSAVLVDEFQDTNERQRAIVEAICGASPGRLFVVGDAR
ncbi:MAG: UvrD-helicase domain-containing protein, partial [Anaerolineales bacterium]|nr:UvrD-helicase domain-containing protein [Anaerolineales bacterium]